MQTLEESTVPEMYFLALDTHVLNDFEYWAWKLNNLNNSDMHRGTCMEITFIGNPHKHSYSST